MKISIIFSLLFLSFAVHGQNKTIALTEFGTIPVWTTVGPFYFNSNSLYENEKQVDFLTALGGEKNARLKIGQEVTYNLQNQTCQLTMTDQNDVLNFNQVYGKEGGFKRTAYAYCELLSDSDKEAYIEIYSNNGVRTYLNNEQFSNYEFSPNIFGNHEMRKVMLRKGINPLLVKYDVGEFAFIRWYWNDWGLDLRVVDRDGKKLEKVSVVNPLDEPRFDIQVTPLVKKSPNGNVQIVHLNIVSGGFKSLKCIINKSEWGKPITIHLPKIKSGYTDVSFQIPVSTINEQSSFSFVSDGKRWEQTVLLEKPRDWSVYLIQHSHTDIGYTNLQSEVLPAHLSYIDQALEYCDQTDYLPDDARFRWSCEVNYPVLEYIKSRPNAQIDRFRERVKQGRIEVGAMYLNLTEGYSDHQLALTFQGIKALSEKGIKVETAIQNDVNGIPINTINNLSPLNVKYVNMGSNECRSHVPFNHPNCFWWQAPGGNKLLAFRGEHYMKGNELKVHTGDIDLFEPRLANYLISLIQLKYPFDLVQIQHSGYQTDNSPPSSFSSKLVEDWNNTYISPKLKTATFNQFMHDMEQKYGNNLEVFQKAWPDWWSDGFGASALEVSLARKTANGLLVSKSLLSRALLEGSIVKSELYEDIKKIDHNLLFFNEHTFGDGEAVNDPNALNSILQWGQKSAFVYSAFRDEKLLNEKIWGVTLPHQNPSKESSILVFNPLSTKRSGIVNIQLTKELFPDNQQTGIFDAITGKELPLYATKTQWEGAYWDIYVEDIPPMGFRKLIIKEKEERKNSGVPSCTSTILENNFYRAAIDSVKGGLMSLIDKETGRELIDSTYQYRFGQIIHEKLIKGRTLRPDWLERSSLTEVKIVECKENPLWKSAILSGSAFGFEKNSIKIEFRLYHFEKKIELNYTVRKISDNNPEAVYVAFPLTAEKFEMAYDAQGAIINPANDLLPATSSDWQCIQSFVAMREPSYQVVMASPDIPLVQFGDINTGKWQEQCKVSKPVFFSWVMNNYWFTNFKASQGGEFKWSYIFTSAKESDISFASKFAQGELYRPTAHVQYQGNTTNGTDNSFNLQELPQNVSLIGFYPSANKKAVIVHLREIEGKPAKISTFLNENYMLSEVGVTEEIIKNNLEEISLNPYAEKFIQITIP